MKNAEEHRTPGDLGPEDYDERIRIGATIKALRTGIGASAEELAHQIGISRPLLQNIEAGRRRLNYKHLPKLAKALNVEPKAIIWPIPTEPAA